MLPVASRAIAGRGVVVLAGSRMDRIDMMLLPRKSALAERGIRTAWSSPGAPHRGGGLPASEPGLVADTQDLPSTVTNRPRQPPVPISHSGIAEHILRRRRLWA